MFTANYIKAGESQAASQHSYDNDHESNKLDGGSGASEGQPITQSGTPGSTDQGSITRQLDDLALNGSGANDGRSRWDMKPTRSPSPLNPDFEGAFLPDERGNLLASGGVASDSPVGQRSHGDSESEPDTDKAGRKSEENENENAQQRGDAWEGSMFPFCEEDC